MGKRARRVLFLSATRHRALPTTLEDEQVDRADVPDKWTTVVTSFELTTHHLELVGQRTLKLRRTHVPLRDPTRPHRCLLLTPSTLLNYENMIYHQSLNNPHFANRKLRQINSTLQTSVHPLLSLSGGVSNNRTSIAIGVISPNTYEHEQQLHDVPAGQPRRRCVVRGPFDELVVADRRRVVPNHTGWELESTGIDQGETQK